MLDEHIKDDEFLYRRVIDKPDYWKSDEGRPTSAVFKDSNGVSVDRQGDRDNESIDKEVIEHYISNYSQKAIIKVTAKYARDIEAYPKYDPIPENVYHSLILDSPDKVELSSSKAKKLSRNSEIIWQKSN